MKDKSTKIIATGVFALVVVKQQDTHQATTQGKSSEDYLDTLRVDPSVEGASVALNPRAGAFAKRIHSFIERSMVDHHSEVPSLKVSTFTNWGSPDGKLDWTINGDELNKQ
ncbi:hypothetical protein VIGAN_10159900 [Vigna angularis var. angularis]|uniref:Uncharacterized protein n=1 Tax=Vigna angularis var. angularis TaxID=157739 RepID=A0A0S3T4A2_PHAAN|nr:hypothetical protein VIGAN_10159900 [Vigna angularis var. angularis]